MPRPSNVSYPRSEYYRKYYLTEFNTCPVLNSFVTPVYFKIR